MGMKITVNVDMDKQTVAVEFDPKEFKTWDFVIASLEQAKSWGEFNRDLLRQQAVMQQMAQQQNAVNLRNKLQL